MDDRRLIDLRSVGPATVRDLNDLGITRVAELAAREGEDLYRRLCVLKGIRVDPCCLDVFNCAIAQAQDPHLPAELCDWWAWSRIRKSEQGVRVLPDPMPTVRPEGTEHTGEEEDEIVYGDSGGGA